MGFLAGPEDWEAVGCSLVSPVLYLALFEVGNEVSK